MAKARARMTTRELENFLTEWLIDVGSWVLEILVVIGIAAVALYIVVGVPLIILINRRL